MGNPTAAVTVSQAEALGGGAGGIARDEGPGSTLAVGTLGLALLVLFFGTAILNHQVKGGKE